MTIDGERGAWPPHRGEIARMIRDRDWSRSPIGPVEGWPAPLRAAVELMLPSPAAISVSWAHPATFLYNDAFIPIAGNRHPAVFGGSAQRDWPEVAAFSAPILRRIEAGESVMLRGQPLDILRSGVTEQATFDVAFSPIAGADGRQAGLLVIVNETTELTQARARIAEAEARFRQFADAASEILWIMDAASLQLEYLSPAFAQIWGADLDRLEASHAWLDLVVPEDRTETMAALRQVQKGERVSKDFRIRRPLDGEERWIGNIAFPLFDLDGRVQRVGGISSDITAARHALERNEVLVGELHHRTRNLLGVVVAMAHRTLGRGGSLESFEARLMALNRAQSLLSQQGAEAVDVGALVRAELAAHAEVAPPKVVLDGPPATLSASQVQNLSLVLHELTTNAVKYGALSQDPARLTVTWLIEPTPAGRRLVLEWNESEVRVEPSERRGFGRELIERAMNYTRGGATRYVLGDGGVSCRFELPLG